nr:hypothetical protein [Actinomycetota bacterium]
VLTGRPDRSGIGAVRLERDPSARAVPGVVDPGAARIELQRAMSTGAGVVRSAASLDQTRRVLQSVVAADTAVPAGAAAYEVANLVTVAAALLDAAAARQESRGAHSRTEFPATSAAWLHRLVL